MLILLIICLIVFLVTYVVPNFAELYASMQAELPAMTQILIAVGTTARNYILAIVGGACRTDHRCSAFGRAARRRARRSTGSSCACRCLGDIWVKYQVAQFSRVLEHAAAGRYSAGAGARKRPRIRSARRC